VTTSPATSTGISGEEVLGGEVVGSPREVDLVVVVDRGEVVLVGGTVVLVGKRVVVGPVVVVVAIVVVEATVVVVANVVVGADVVVDVDVVVEEVVEETVVVVVDSSTTIRTADAQTGSSSPSSWQAQMVWLPRDALTGTSIPTTSWPEPEAFLLPRSLHPARSQQRSILRSRMKPEPLTVTSSPGRAELGLTESEAAAATPAVTNCRAKRSDTRLATPTSRRPICPRFPCIPTPQ
jgi:hypothetical protein